MNRLIEKMVCLGFVTAWRFATWPTSRSPSLVNATTEGVVRPPSALGMTTGSPPSMTATTELVVPRSIPMILETMGNPFLLYGDGPAQPGKGLSGQRFDVGRGEGKGCTAILCRFGRGTSLPTI